MKLANLPQDVLQRYEDPMSSYSCGWSHGREALKNGKRDILKGEWQDKAHRGEGNCKKH